ncbi:MAG TPA: SIMPL domain-containing protein [Woeseiaceae bacterium]|nr:SIMPL domain-containing protein [Woeseiaceae bacterium]
MRILFAVSPLLFAILIPNLSQADWPQFPFVHAEGEARVEVPPEKASIRVSLTTFHRESEIGLETLQVQLTKAVDVLEQAGVPEDQITGFDLKKMVVRSRDDDNNELEILGYYFSRDFEVELTDLETFSALVTELMAIDNVTTVDADFDIENRDRVESNLVREAGEDARRRAEEMARTMDVSIESVFAISESPVASVGLAFGLTSDSYTVMGERPSKRGLFTSTIFVPEAIELRKSVNVLFRLRER